MLTLLEIIKRSTDFLEKHGVENPRLNAELLVGHSLGLKRMQLYLQFERPLTEPELAKIRPLVKRRSEREPLQYVVGTTEFSGLTLKVDRRALIPRPETEYLIELLTQRLAATPPSTVLDLGTGTGAIALALAKVWPNAVVTGVEKSADALALARENAVTLGLEMRVQLLASDWFSQVPATQRYELIVSNPPYLSDAETDATQAEVKGFEPLRALSAGPDGARDLEQIIREARSFLAPGGLLALETGIAQHARLQAYAQVQGYARIESLTDLTGRDRYLLAAG
ncbi:MAG TPA: peptide chain release factor N(5)-glutamine methyltransferase [Candidatus Didemnitutus sp.]|nr:peptide chain release factor N(5)-glutamine methyltransferase [Candidatus Didemnitutus sp.]